MALIKRPFYPNEGHTLRGSNWTPHSISDRLETYFDTETSQGIHLAKLRQDWDIKNTLWGKTRFLRIYSCAIQTSPTDCSGDSWRDTFFRKHEHGTLWILICGALEKHLLTYLLTYSTHLFYYSWR